MAREILIASGKGGAGKTTVSSSLSKYLGDKAVIADYDVDAANLSILTSKSTKTSDRFYTGYVAEINTEYCIGCGKCEQACTFDAIERVGRTYKIDPYSCEGCGVCYDLCISKAVSISEKSVGEWYEEESRFGSVLYSAKLDPGSDNSGRLVSFLKDKAQERAEKDNTEYIISDAPPGIGCPVIASMTGINLLILVVEMGVTGVKDAVRLLNVAKQFKIKTLCVFNKVGIAKEGSETEIELLNMLERENIEVIGKIPYNREFINMLQQKKLPIESSDNTITKNMYSIFKNIINKL